MGSKNLLLMFDRPTEPIYVPKGDGKVSFDIPTNYVVNTTMLNNAIQLEFLCSYHQVSTLT